MQASNSFQADLGGRRYDLDWVRIGAFMLLILYHVGMYYVTWDFHVKTPHPSATIEPLMMLSSPWRLSLLFVVSGVATAYLLERQGIQRFLGQRSVRLLVPLVFGIAVIVPPQSYLEVVEKLGYSGSYGDFLGLYFSGYHGLCHGSDCLRIPTWNHLWFVAYLWVYTLALYVAVRLSAGWVPKLRLLAETRLGGAGAVLWPILYLALARVVLVRLYPQNHALLGDWYSHALYGAAFLFGFILAGTRAPWVYIQRARWVTLGLAVLGWAAICAYIGAYRDDAAVPPIVLRVAMSVVYGAEQWLAIAAVLGFARRHLNRDNSARRYLTTAIFPVYILHQTVIILAAHALKPSHIQPLIEGPLLVAVTAAASFLGYEVIRRLRFLRPFFGLGIEPGVAQGARVPVRAAWQDVH